uniref:Uncharacterized protein n=2 Tax=Candidatus Kentrum sp. FM TaxID=2126340 RepID=A0A450WWR4_9GAMM|nr:MAG: hypothetical protein BECKFM1743A_GA0114220_108343 [Candidatus Kentron sp. FM]VFK21457.1 MAG: hypothetical protein BECKFM1743B_GA0114221_107882 [Candidatus Kentron sp. FM]
MTTLYAWNTARPGFCSLSECTRGAPIPPYKRLRHPTGNNYPTLLAYLSQILVQLLCCNDNVRRDGIECEGPP